MYSPVFLSSSTTSGSPPVLSISLSDHSFSALTSSLACTLAHSRLLWRFMFFSKRAFNALSKSSRCSGDKSFLVLLMFNAFIALIVVASRVSYLLLRCAPPTMRLRRTRAKTPPRARTLARTLLAPGLYVIRDVSNPPRKTEEGGPASEDLLRCRLRASGGLFDKLCDSPRLRHIDGVAALDLNDH